MQLAVVGSNGKEGRPNDRHILTLFFAVILPYSKGVNLQLSTLQVSVFRDVLTPLRYS